MESVRVVTGCTLSRVRHKLSQYSSSRGSDTPGRAGGYSDLFVTHLLTATLRCRLVLHVSQTDRPTTCDRADMQQHVCNKTEIEH